MRVTTEAARAGESFDFWHSLFPHIGMRRTTREDGHGAPARACPGDGGIAFTDLDCAPTAARLFVGRVAHVQLCAVVAGPLDRTRVVDGKGVSVGVRTGGRAN